MSEENPYPFWSGREIEMINVVEVFRQKPAIMKKAEDYLNQLKQALIEETAHSQKLFPPETDLTKGQLVRGENHKGFPFLSLDMPKKFSRSEMFTYRTLFWWGHYLVFAFILKGEKLPQYLNRLLAGKHGPAAGAIQFACHKTPWEWEWTSDNFKNVAQTPDEEIRQSIDSIQYLKLCRFFPVSDPSFTSLDWTAAGLTAYREMTELFLMPGPTEKVKPSDAG